MDTISSNTSSTTPASALHYQQQVQEAAMVALPPREEAAASNVKPKQAAGSGLSGERKPRPPQDQTLNCPRCDSTRTKFCYYNNYSTTQPRYFCKSCRRYWTQGGILRNVPVGGGCRKNKQKHASATSSAPSTSSSSSNGSKKVNTMQQLMMMPTAITTVDFPNVLPTFMSTDGGFELPTSMEISLPFTPLSLSSNSNGGSGAPPSFMDMLRGEFLDGISNHGASSNRMALPFPPQHATQLVGPLLQGVEEVKPMAGGDGLQWLLPSQHAGGFAPAAGSAAGVLQQKQPVVGDGDSVDKKLMMGMGSNSSSNTGGASASTNKDYYWHGDLINNSSLI